MADRAIILEAAVLDDRPAGIGEARPARGGVDVVVAKVAREADVAVELELRAQRERRGVRRQDALPPAHVLPLVAAGAAARAVPPALQP